MNRDSDPFPCRSCPQNPCSSPVVLHRSVHGLCTPYRQTIFCSCGIPRAIISLSVVSGRLPVCLYGVQSILRSLYSYSVFCRYGALCNQVQYSVLYRVQSTYGKCLCQAPLGGRVASARGWGQRGGIEATRANWKVGLDVGILFAIRALPASPGA